MTYEGGRGRVWQRSRQVAAQAARPDRYDAELAGAIVAMNFSWRLVDDDSVR